MQSQFKWIVKEITPVIMVWRNGDIQKRVLCITEETPSNEYPNELAIDFTKDKIFLLDEVQEWDLVEVLCNLSYNKVEATKSVFNSIRWWKINMIKSVEKQQEIAKQKIVDDDIPF